MDDLVEQGRPPGDPPDMTGSWVKKVTGSNAGGMPNPEELIDDAFVSERVRLELPNGEEGEPVITIEQEVLEAMNGLWKHCMIVKVLGRVTSIAALIRKLREMWKPKGSMYVMDLPRQYFMIRFGDEDEYLAALAGGPWRVFGSYLVVQAWTPSFDPLSDDIVTTPVWIRLANIPINFYHKSILMGIAKALGKPVKVDLTTLNFERARFARICVEVNLQKPLKGSILINGDRYFVSYEGLPQICSSCGMFGHLVHMCPKVIQERAAIERASQEQRIISVDVHQSINGNPGRTRQADDGFTPVRNKSGKRGESSRSKTAAGNQREGSGRNLREIPQNKETPNILVSNSFGRLMEDLESPEIRQEAVGQGENKENEIIKENANIQIHKNQTMSVNRESGVIFSAGNSNETRPKVNPLAVKKNGGSYKGPDNKITKPKSVVKSRPMRGLVFGPTGGGIELSSNGKRLRVEKENLGRAGGPFLQDCSVRIDGDLPQLAEGFTESNPTMGVVDANLEKDAGMQEAPLETTESHEA
ncbi:uncharacterized protein LOC108837533 [Raphanus sativus]|uniref:Uncharacterized protein LOC108837533 n=1 Tax=Raphanus sativus TaxID=3726 RepID=A0A6J0M209_RAPSA|nr:uncharacterized protein LOC108837533 [Raphanus sativus]